MPTIAPVIFVVLLFACQCRAREPQSSKGRSEWERKDVAKAVEYRFKGPDQEPLSLISGQKLNTKLLKKSIVKSAELSTKQVTALLDAIFSPAHHVPVAACYDPHHIFVFYAKDGHPLRAIEVCFECANVVTTPELGEKFETHHDFVALARLTAALGLWPKDQTVEQFAELMKAREPAPEE